MSIIRTIGRTGIALLLACAATTPAVAGPTSRRASHPAVTAQPRKDKWWRVAHQRINDEVRRTPGARLLFIGDSITFGWRTAGYHVWQRTYARRKPLNLGISGDQTQHVLWRLEHGNLAGLRPKVIVLLIGVNNTFDRRHRPRQIAAGVARILDVLNKRLPKTKVLLLGVFPAGQRPGPLRDKIKAINRELAKHAKVRGRKQLTFLDIGKAFLGSRDTLSTKIAYDQLHLTARGYSIWAREIEPTLRRLLGEPPPGKAAPAKKILRIKPRPSALRRAPLRRR